jgi:hypothetical protein
MFKGIWVRKTKPVQESQFEFRGTLKAFLSVSSLTCDDELASKLAKAVSNR